MDFLSCTAGFEVALVLSVPKAVATNGAQIQLKAGAGVPADKKNHKKLKKETPKPSHREIKIKSPD